MTKNWSSRGWIACIVIAPVWQMSASMADPTAPPKWVATEDGAFIINLNTKAAWTRCAEGMRWNGSTCAGKPTLLSHAEALLLAQSRAATDGMNWRLPTVMELKHLVAHTKDRPDAQPAPFSAAPGGWYWSGTASAHTTQVNQYNYANIMRGRTSANVNQQAVPRVWAVNLSTGQVNGDVARRSKLPVLLVAPHG
jgi:hypothetical protein